MHRLDGPASSYNGTDVWYFNGKRHREDGPAYLGSDGTAWWIHGRLHREDGPALELPDGTKTWFLYGRELDPLEVFLIQGEKNGL